ncbi:TetR/AcrR family transcriptional regulator [Nannocystis punicea]|uniref:TetR/AcrR family transcriptional regulator n=1 Tax=Nannocystis punicea TaxID=2995304 RepID=A0ABY7H808_9BACT|nr:TetR/AcrR family transcriptional regulator [Nannocystis poenicansa]WAS95396.1 TetR/AcrR family transcriptional regulator [Nannocystis poenicansa]
MKASGQGKRGSKARALVRGEPVVQGVLAATLEELGQVGYRALRIEDVAARAGVNKTTVYRRWPSKPELVRAAIVALPGESLNISSQGSLRVDFLEIARRVAALGRSPVFRGVGRVIAAEGADPELMAIAKSVRETYATAFTAMFEAAAARGELASGVDPMLLLTVLGAAIQQRLLSDPGGLDEPTLVRIVDLLLHGALAREAHKPGSTRPRAARATRST